MAGAPDNQEILEALDEKPSAFSASGSCYRSGRACICYTLAALCGLEPRALHCHPCPAAWRCVDSSNRGHWGEYPAVAFLKSFLYLAHLRSAQSEIDPAGHKSNDAPPANQVGALFFMYGCVYCLAIKALGFYWKTSERE